MTIATGVSMGLAYKKETTWGTDPSPATGGQYLRRVTSDLGLSKATFQSKEMTPTYQLTDFRHGGRRVEGTIKGELSGKTWQDFMGSLCRAAWGTAATTGAIITVTAAAVAPHFVRSAGSFLTDGFKVGDIVRWSGWATGATANNGRNYIITALTATQMTVSDLIGTAGATGTVVAKAAGDSVTCAVQGKKVMMAASGQTNDSYCIEHRYTDIGVYNRFQGCRISNMSVNIPASGMAEITFGFMGKDMVSAGSAFLTSPTAATTSGSLSGVSGKVSAGGVEYGIVTSLQFKADAGMAVGDVIGSVYTPDVFVGRMIVTGTMNVYFQDNVLLTAFLNETKIKIMAAFADGSSNAAEFMSFVIQSVKLGSCRPQDAEQGIQAAIDFTAVYNGAGGSGQDSDQTTLAIQDSLAT